MPMRCLVLLALPALLTAQTLPELPRAVPSTAMPVSTRTIRVGVGAAALQAALNAATGGDELLLPDSAEYVGNFLLPAHTGTVVVRSATVPAPGVRVTPATAARFARIITPNSAPAIETATAASGWRLIGLRVEMAPTAPLNYGIIRLGTASETTVAAMPRDIVLDRLAITATPTGQTRRCIAMNGGAAAVIHSWIAECHSKGFDTQGIGGWSGTGPYLIENNYIEGSGQNIMFGGADPRIPGVSPSDITIRRNHLYKPLTWGNGRWTVKAAFELKHGVRVLFDANVIENHWADAQVGYAILLQALTDENTAPWVAVRDVTIRHSVIRNSTSGFNLASRVAYGPNPVMPTDPSRRILLDNVLWERVGRDPVSGGAGRLMQLIGDHEDVTITRNTFTLDTVAQTAVSLASSNGRALRTTLARNVFAPSEYGIKGDGSGEGTVAINDFWSTATVRENVVLGRPLERYPAGTTGTLPAPAGVGVDTLALSVALAGVVSGAAVTHPPPVAAPVLTCDGAPVGFTIMGTSSTATTSRTERTAITRAGQCLGVFTLASSSRYAAHIRTATGWRTLSTTYTSRAAAAAAIVAAGGK